MAHDREIMQHDRILKTKSNKTKIRSFKKKEQMGLPQRCTRMDVVILKSLCSGYYSTSSNIPNFIFLHHTENRLYSINF